MDGDKSLLKKVAETSNSTMMIVALILTVIALSVGLAFFFLVAGRVGYGVGIAMFIVAAPTFVIGEWAYVTRMKKIRDNQQ